MTLASEEKEKLRGYKTNPDCDDVRFKEIIKKKLLDNRLIAYVLNNKKLQESDAPLDEYFGVSILPCYLIKPTQTDVENYLCYDVKFDGMSGRNEYMKCGQIVFTILCDQKNIIEKTTGIARHDLLAALILDEFNWTNYFGMQIHCIADEPAVIATDYASRTLIFELTTFNGTVKTNDNISRYILNDEVRT